jgi:threonylcarbamoyladenosine tRNA methylthiotransferase MtaB
MNEEKLNAADPLEPPIVPTVAFRTLGCKVNHYETGALREAFLAVGFEVVPFDGAREADVYVVNTCTVTGQAAKKTGQYLRGTRSRHPRAILIAVGCHAQLDDGSLPVDVLIGTTRRADAPRLAREALADRAEGRSTRVDIREDVAGRTAYEAPESLSDVEDVRAFVKIQDGCDARCAYCVIPLARGPARSRDAASVLAEVPRLVEAGCREVVLTGIHVSSYGMERDGRGTASPSDGLPLLDLAARIASMPGVLRVRLGSIEPESIDADFAGAAAAIPGLCPHFHIPLQSGSASVLARMRRRYAPDRFLRTLAELRGAFPSGAFTTDVIVGFPGETDSEFEESLSFCASAGLHRIHVFRYSDRRGTVASAMPGKVPASAVTQRARRMKELSARLALDFHASLAGQIREVLVESFATDGAARGYTPEYVFARIEKGGDLPVPALGECVWLRVTEWDAQGVRGVRVSP